MRTPAAAAAVATLLLFTACGGDARYAGLTQSEAAERASAAISTAKANGTIDRELTEALTGTPEGAMSRAGSVPLASVSSRVGTDVAELVKGRVPAAGDPAWVGVVALPGLGSTLGLCVYVQATGSSIDVRPRC